MGGDGGNNQSAKGFYHRLARRIMEITSQHTTGVEWEWPLMAEALDTVVLWPINDIYSGNRILHWNSWSSITYMSFERGKRRC